MNRPYHVDLQPWGHSFQLLREYNETFTFDQVGTKFKVLQNRNTLNPQINGQISPICHKFLYV